MLRDEWRGEWEGGGSELHAERSGGGGASGDNSHSGTVSASISDHRCIPLCSSFSLQACLASSSATSGGAIRVQQWQPSTITQRRNERSRVTLSIAQRCSA